jgi:hypothetical protein
LENASNSHMNISIYIFVIAGLDPAIQVDVALAYPS